MRTITILLFVLGLVATGLTPARFVRADTFSSAVWQLTRLPNGTVVNPPSSRYTVQFLSDGTVAIQADCNRASGRLNSGTSDLITITQSTLATCQSGSWGDYLLKSLDEATKYSLTSDGGLRIDGPWNGGYMLFRKAPS